VAQDQYLPPSSSQQNLPFDRLNEAAVPIKIPKNLEPILNVAEEEDDSLQKLANKRNVVLIALVAPYVPARISPSQFLYASLGLPEEFGVETLIGQIRKSTKCRNLYLVINSPGGYVHSSYKIAKALRRNFDDITVFVPHIAASGGTLVALAGNKIVMGIMSNLTPIDVQLRNGEDAISANALPRAFSRLVDFFAKVEKDDAPFPWVCLAEKIDPIQLETFSGETQTMQDYATEILTLANPKAKVEDIKKIVKEITVGFDSHSAVIGYERAKQLKLSVVSKDEHEKEWELMRDWIGKYILKSEGQHFIRCVTPNKKKTSTRGKRKENSKK
jgi:hypothetical protein